MSNLLPPNRRWSLGLIKRKFQSESDSQQNDLSREKWSGRADFFLSCLGDTVGLGNVWRFPYLCYRNGGGVFFIPYFLCLFCVGLPLMALEMSVGQFSSTGPYHAWDFVKGFRGIGLCMTMCSYLLAFYYTVIISWAVYYFFMSFSISGLPWTKCGDWSTQLCQDRLKAINESFCQMAVDLTPYENGTCYNVTSNTIYGIYDEKIALKYGIKPSLSAAEYLGYVGLQTELSTGLDNIGPVRWEMALCLLVAWLLVFFSLISGIKSLGKVVYFTATFPYVLLLILFICGMTQEGSADGLIFYMKPNVTKLIEKSVWKDAAAQIFFSLSLSLGGMIAYASFNRFHKDIIRDAIAISFSNCATSIFAGCVIFSFLGGYAKKTGVPVEDVAAKGVELAFIVYAQACTYLPLSNLWALLFFFMLIILGLDSAFTLIEATVVCITELKPQWIIHRRKILIAACLISFLFGLSMATPGGSRIVTLLDDHVMSFNVIFLALFECGAVALYGPQRLAKDIRTMIGEYTMGCIPWRMFKWWFIACWCVLSPTVLLLVLIMSVIQYKGKDSKAYNGIGWTVLLSTLIPLFTIMVVTFIKAKGSFGERAAEFMMPTETWGPYALKHRKLIKYVKNFQLNPRNLPADDANETS